MSKRAIRKLIRNGGNPIPQMPRPTLRPVSLSKTRGAFGNLARKARFLASSAAQGNEISRERGLRKAYADFYATREGKEFSRRFGKSYQDSNPRNGNGSNGSNEHEFHDPAELPKASSRDHPVDHIEPEQRMGISIGGAQLTRDELDLICDTLKHVFRWALDGANGSNGDAPLVGVGKRCNIAISRMRPDLGRGLIIDSAQAKRFDQGFKEHVLIKTGIWFGRVLEWLRRGDPLSSRGERVYLLAYKLWPDEIDARTLASLGGMNQKTRQASDKKANCLRDTMSGLKAITMRADITRARCRASQLAK